MLNVALFITLFVGLGFDWMLQTDWEAQNKMTNWLPRLLHSLIYSLASLQLMIWSAPGPYMWVIFTILLISHFIIDQRGIVKWWMRVIKQISREQVNNPRLTGWLQIGIDQWMHVFVIYIISLVF